MSQRERITLLDLAYELAGVPTAEQSLAAEREACGAIARAVAERYQARLATTPVEYWEERAILDVAIQAAHEIEQGILKRGGAV